MSDDIHFESWYQDFTRFAGDVYPGRYTRERVNDLIDIAREISALARQKASVIVAHNYTYPELQEMAEAVGDSLALSQYVARQDTRRVDFCGVWFMGETAKAVVGPRASVYMPARAGCSLESSINHGLITDWIARHPDGLVISYVNSDVRTKAMSHVTCTSRNAAQVLAHAARTHPGKNILFLPDRHLGTAALAQTDVNPDLVELYQGACHVHLKFTHALLEEAINRHPEADLLVHPECCCAPGCVEKIVRRAPPFTNAYFLSTGQMFRHVATSAAQEFLVATETGMLYRLRKTFPQKTFFVVTHAAVCEFMKMNSLEGLRDSLRYDQVEVELDNKLRTRANTAIQRMLDIQ
jgi:quinolinate synthase